MAKADEMEYDMLRSDTDTHMYDIDAEDDVMM